MKTKMLGDLVLVQPAKQTGMTPGNLHVPEVAQGRTQVGVVVATGPGHYRGDGVFVPLDVKPGDTVRWVDYVHRVITIEGQEFNVMHESEIACIQEDEVES